MDVVLRLLKTMFGRLNFVMLAVCLVFKRGFGGGEMVKYCPYNVPIPLVKLSVKCAFRTKHWLSNCHQFIK